MKPVEVPLPEYFQVPHEFKVLAAYLAALERMPLQPRQRKRIQEFAREYDARKLQWMCKTLRELRVHPADFELNYE